MGRILCYLGWHRWYGVYYVSESGYHVRCTRCRIWRVMRGTEGRMLGRLLCYLGWHRWGRPHLCINGTYYHGCRRCIEIREIK